MKNKLTKIARKAIEKSLEEGGKDYNPEEDTKEEFSEEKASFVTLNTIKPNKENEEKELRGCIGSLEPIKGVPLWKNVMQNAKNAAFGDPRFPPIQNKEELKNIKIEVSVLSSPKEIEFSSSKELLEKINKNMGLILKKSSTNQKATFLPQVWEDLEEKEKFLDYLCLKAGLNPDEWKKTQKKFIFGITLLKNTKNNS